jgi:homoserine kinase
LKEISFRAPATIANFGPGFDIFALALEEPHDVIKVKLNDTKSINLKVIGGTENIPISENENTAGLAAIHFFKKVNPAAGVDVEIRKGMKSCAGLGTSGASAVACVSGLNKLFQANLGDNEIIEIASRGEIASGGAAHADNVAGCLLGGFILVRNYSPLDVVKIEVSDIPIVICVIKKTQRTTRGSIPQSISLTQTKEQMTSCASLIHAMLGGNLKNIGQAVNRDHISEPARARSIAGYGEVKKKILEAGAYGCNVSGGGSSVFAICEEHKRNEIGEIMNTHFNQHGVENEVIMTKASNQGLKEINEL